MSTNKEHKPDVSPVVVETDLDRLRRDVYRSDMEKFKLLMDMFRKNALLKKAKITHK
ncbi:hypothetical protein [Flavipsychrobacter stenotrophus]|uniref:hypothetical protein n=1 Tax=Flavipsychrobacter stenotrophus TaxID=2077091 RepID=UPI001374AAC6|nr:hypothetical protein [Flavipsychrobacter stenotrophus]